MAPTTTTTTKTETVFADGSKVVVGKEVVSTSAQCDKTTAPSEWITPATRRCVCGVYTVMQAADDFNTVACHVGSMDRTSAVEMFGVRLSYGCMYCCCPFQPRIKTLKTQFEERHNLIHQEDNCCALCMYPEYISHQIVKEHQARYGAPMPFPMDRY